MAEKKDKQTFNTKVHEVCSDDKLRPIFQCVHFENGYAYATTGQIAIKQTLSFQSVLDPENLDGKSLHKDSYRAVMTYDIAQANAEGIECWTDNGQHVFFEYYETKEGETKPDIEKMFQKTPGLTGLTFVGIDPELLIKLRRALYVPGDCGIRCQFTGVATAILIDVMGVDEQAAILIPTILSETLF